MLAPLLFAALLAPPAEVPPGADRARVPTAESLLETAVPLDATGTVLLDKPNGRVLVKGEVCLRRGSLEMLVCLPQTKEHESVLKYPGDARTLHAGLVALGLEPGGPVRFSPEFVPPRGPILDLTLHWTDEKGEPRSADARTWVRTSTAKWYERDLSALPAGMTLPPEMQLRYDAGNEQLIWFGRMSEADRDAALTLTKDETVRRLIGEFYAESQPSPMDADFVFVGSGFYTETVPAGPDGGGAKTVTRYAAEGGEVVCVANFQVATIDVAEKSSAEGQGVLYEAATEAIPAEGTPVLIAFAPRPAPADSAATSAAAPEPDAAGPDRPE